MPVVHESTTPAETAACRASASPCAACAKRSGSVVSTGTIHGYGAEPRNGWVPRYTADETAAGLRPPTFGVELETQRLTGRDRFSLTGDEAVAAASPRGHWFAQQDSSVDGPEFASQPATLAYWRSIAGPVGSFMRTLIHGGLRSHDGTLSCSMHVNIGADAFGSADHLARFLRLATGNPRWTTKLAQRTHAQVASWASFGEYPDNASCVRLASDYVRHGTAYTSHASAVNLGNYGRIEFRVPRGTLRLDRFMAKLEWVAAMVEYTRDAASRPVAGAFTPWVLARRDAYPEFVAFLAEVMPGRVLPAAPAPIPATGSFTPCNSLDAGRSQRCGRVAGHFGSHENTTTYARWAA